MLTLQLRELEDDGVVKRKIYQQIPPRVDYSLTEFGQSLEPILLLISNWGSQYVETIIERRTVLQSLLHEAVQPDAVAEIAQTER